MQALSHPVVAVELSDEAKRWLGSSSSFFSIEHDVMDRTFALSDFAEILTEAKNFDDRFFVQIGKRPWRRRFSVAQPSLPDAFMYSFNREHMARSLYIHDSIKKNYPVFCYLYEDDAVSFWSEFRLFIRERKVIGVSPRHYHDAHPEIERYTMAIRTALSDFSDRLVEALHMETVVVDAFLTWQEDETFGTTLAELIPFDPHADPCLFTWRDGGDFDGTFRFRKATHNPYRGTMGQTVQRMDFGLFREEEYGITPSHLRPTAASLNRRR